MTPEDRFNRWLSWLTWMVCGGAILLFVWDVWLRRSPSFHPHFAWEAWFGFSSGLGLLAPFLLVGSAWLFAWIVHCEDAYYDE